MQWQMFHHKWRLRINFNCICLRQDSKRKSQCIDKDKSPGTNPTHKHHRRFGEELLSTHQPPSHRRYVASFSMLYRYFNWKCSKDVNLLFPPNLTFTARIRHASYLVANHPHQAIIKVHWSSSLPQTVTLSNKLQRLFQRLIQY